MCLEGYEVIPLSFSTSMQDGVIALQSVVVYQGAQRDLAA